MTRVSVTRSGASTSPIVWVSMTPWTRSAMQTHVSIPGGEGIGVTFTQGSDNATCTLQGRVPWTTRGQAQYEALPNTRLTISNGIDVRTGIAGTPVPQDGNPAWIFFSLSVTEEADRWPETTRDAS